MPEYAKVAELVDALDLGSSIVRCESSSLSFRTRQVAQLLVVQLLVLFLEFRPGGWHAPGDVKEKE